MKKWPLPAVLLQMAGSFTLAQQPANKNKNLSPGVRVKNLETRMTLDEKMMRSQVYGFKSFKYWTIKGF
ncbi:MAG: hypothetical protein ABI707_04635 [Ferruginibacter sp.]